MDWGEGVGAVLHFCYCKQNASIKERQALVLGFLRACKVDIGSLRSLALYQGSFLRREKRKKKKKKGDFLGYCLFIFF